MLVENDEDKEAEDVPFLLMSGNAPRDYGRNGKRKGQVKKTSCRQVNWRQGALTKEQARSGERRDRGHAARALIVRSFIYFDFSRLK